MNNPFFSHRTLEEEKLKMIYKRTKDKRAKAVVKMIFYEEKLKWCRFSSLVPSSDSALHGAPHNFNRRHTWTAGRSVTIPLPPAPPHAPLSLCLHSLCLNQYFRFKQRIWWNEQWFSQRMEVSHIITPQGCVSVCVCHFVLKMFPIWKQPWAE